MVQCECSQEERVKRRERDGFSIKAFQTEGTNTIDHDEKMDRVIVLLSDPKRQGREGVEWTAVCVRVCMSVCVTQLTERPRVLTRGKPQDNTLLSGCPSLCLYLPKDVQNLDNRADWLENQRSQQSVPMK